MAVKDVTVRLQASTEEAQRKLDAIYAKTEELKAANPDIKVKLDKAAAISGLSVLRQEIKDTSKDAENLSGDVKDVGKSAAAAAPGATGLLTPMVALVAAGAALSPVLVTVGVGLAGFGAAAVAAVDPVLKAAQATGGLKANMAKLDPEQQTVAKSLLALQADFDKFSKTLQPELFSVFNSGLSVASTLLAEIQPVALATGKALDTVVAAIGQNLKSQEWTQFFSWLAKNAGPDLILLARTIGQVVDALPPLLEALDPVAKVLLTVVGDVARFVGVLARAQPGLIQFALAAGGVLLAVSKLSAAWKLITEATIVTKIEQWTASLVTLKTAEEGAAAAGEGLAVKAGAGGVATAVGAAGTAAATATTAFAGLGAIGIATAANALDHLTGNAKAFVAQLAVQDHAIGDNAAGYQKLAADLNRTTSSQTLLAKALGVTNLRGAADGVTQLKDAEAAATAKAKEITAASKDAGSSIGDMGSQAKLTAADINTLYASLHKLLDPLTQNITDAVTFKNDQIALAAALKKSHDQLGLNSAAQRAASTATATAAQDALILSQNIFQTTGSAQKAVKPLEALARELQNSGAKGAYARDVISELRHQIALLKSKTVDINVNTHYYQSGASTKVPHAAGGVTLPGELSLVGEQGPELARFPAGTQIYSHQDTTRILNNGGGAAVTIEINVPRGGAMLPDSFWTEFAKGIRIHGGDPAITTRKVKFA